MGIYPINLAGESMANADGTSRQTEIAKCRPRQPVQLVREPNNPYDPNAILVLSSNQIGIGYIERETAEWLANRIDRGQPISAVILDIGKSSANLFGVVLSVATSGEDPLELAATSSPSEPKRSTANDQPETGQAGLVGALLGALTRAFKGGR